MKKIEIQKKYTENLLKLVKENPDLEIVPMVSSECVTSDDFGWWSAEWGEAELDEYWVSEERIYVKSNDYEELVEEFTSGIYEENPDIKDKEAEILAEERVKKLKWNKAIMVRINEL